MALQQLGCPRVCVVEGGFTALVDVMVASKGCVDTGVLVGHDEGRWAEYCRNNNSSSSSNVNEEISSQHHTRDKVTTTVDHHLDNGGDGDGHSNSFSSSSTVASLFNSSSSGSSKVHSPGQHTTGAAVGLAVAADLSNVSGMINVKKARDSLSVQQQMKMALEVT